MKDPKIQLFWILSLLYIVYKNISEFLSVSYPKKNTLIGFGLDLSLCLNFQLAS